MRRYHNDPRVITARYDCICAETGKEIKKGDQCLYYPIGKSVFSLESNQYYEYKKMVADWEMGYNY